MSISRAKKILQMAIQNQPHEPNDPEYNNDHKHSESNLARNDELASVLSGSFIDIYTDCKENEQHNVLENTNNPESLSANLLDNPHSYEIVENIIIEEIFLAEAEPSHDNIPERLPVCPELKKKLVDYSDSDSEPKEPAMKRKKRCQVKKSEWASEINKKNREKGKEYYGTKKINDAWKRDIKKPKKNLKPRCNCKERRNGAIQCHLISQEDREALFAKFWNLTWDQKRIYVENTIKVVHTNRQRDRKDPKKSKRAHSFIYYLKKGENMVRVCKSLYLNTLCIGKSCVWGWKIGSLERNNTEEQVIKTCYKKPFDHELKTMEDFLDELPKMPSHYCRKRTDQLYIQPDISSKRQLFELYTDYARSRNIKPLSIATFSNTLTIKKISIFKPKKDLCETCNGYKLGHISKNAYEEHISKKNEARMEKESDKDTMDFVFTADLQAVLLAPRSSVSSNYYKTKLCVHNWCIYDLKKNYGSCFIWNEAEGGLNSDEFATILSKFFIEKVIPRMGEHNRYIILYTDGCTYQNRNIVLSNALLNVAMLHNVTIEQKYLEVGHTQMEVDSMHAMIEKKLRNQVINVPAEYISICKKAKKVKPYQVEYLNYSYFKSFKDIKFYNSIRPGKMKGDPKVRKLS